jgi:hypothetical protein
MWLIQTLDSLLNLSICKEYQSMAKAKTPRSGNSSKKVVSLSSTRVVSGNGSHFKPETLEEEIRRRAYELYEQRGRTPGGEDKDWLLAEQEVVARYQEQPGA